MNRITFPLLILSIAFVAGCRKRAQPPVATEPQTSEPAPVAPAAKPGISAPSAPPAIPPVPGTEKIEDRLPTAPPNSSKDNPVDLKLTEALQRFHESNGRMPMDFSELVKAKLIPAVPTPPAGKRYALDRPNMQVVLIAQ